MKKDFLLYGEDKDKVIEKLRNVKYVTRKPKKRIKNKPEYINIPVAFDIESTSTYIDGHKFAFMYVWQMAIDDIIILGRTWEELQDLIDVIRDIFNVSSKKIFVIYIHNMEFEFQYMRKYFEWEVVFASKTRKPIYAKTKDGFEFRCSYILSGYSLEKLAENLIHKMEKKVGQLDYKQIRTYKTPLTEEELEYCIEDVKIIIQFIREEMDRGENLADIPITKTGYVRRYTRNKTLKNNSNYRNLITKLTVEPEEYKLLKQAFQGGFTHANHEYVSFTVEDVASYDFTSSYPAVMVSEEFPMSKGERVPKIDNIDFFYKLIKSFCCLIDIEIRDLKPLNGKDYEHILSYSRCRDVVEGVIDNSGKKNVKIKGIDNGRIVQAKRLKTTITEVDFITLTKFYDFKFKVLDMYIYRKAYLPKALVEAILDLYVDKTALKDVAGKEVEYQVSKGMLNSLFGMTCMDIVRDTVAYSDGVGWSEIGANTQDQISTYNENGNRFLFYPWGVWITAYARRNLFTGIYELGDDYVYSDTDSVKVKNREKHTEYFEQYNKHITNKINKVLDFYKIPREKAAPKTIKGEVKPLGVWDYEGKYDLFKTLGAKRYMWYGLTKPGKDGKEVYDAKLSLTVSGINKKKAVPYLLEKYNNNITEIFINFADGLVIPENYSGKLSHVYLDKELTYDVVDYLGIPCTVTCKSSVHLEEATSSVSLSDAFTDYLAGFVEFSE